MYFFHLDLLKRLFILLEKQRYRESSWGGGGRMEQEETEAFPVLFTLQQPRQSGLVIVFILVERQSYREREKEHLLIL